MPPFMAIHYINAYEERGEGDGPAAAVIVDCCEHYGDPAIIERLVLHSLRLIRDKDVTTRKQAKDPGQKYQLLLQSILMSSLASGDKKYGVWYRVKALPGTKTLV